MGDEIEPGTGFTVPPSAVESIARSAADWIDERPWGALSEHEQSLWANVVYAVADHLRRLGWADPASVARLRAFAQASRDYEAAYVSWTQRPGMTREMREGDALTRLDAARAALTVEDLGTEGEC